MDKKTLATRTKEKFSLDIAEFYEPLAFSELSIGDRFVALPFPGDNSGHGGFKQIHYVFMKTEKVYNYWGRDCGNAVSVKNGRFRNISDKLLVIKVQ